MTLLFLNQLISRNQLTLNLKGQEMTYFPFAIKKARKNKKECDKYMCTGGQRELGSINMINYTSI